MFTTEQWRHSARHHSMNIENYVNIISKLTIVYDLVLTHSPHANQHISNSQTYELDHTAP